MPERRRSRAGVTLIEILAVLMILSLLMGLGVAVLRNANKDLGVRAAAGRIVTILRGAHEHARAENSPAWVVFTVQEPTAAALTRETVGMWHFEEDGAGAFGKGPTVNGPLIAPGRVGMCYRFRRTTETIDLGPIPIQSPDQGLSLEMWFWRAPGGGKSVLCSAGFPLEVVLEAGGRVNARVLGVTLNSGDIVVPRESWVHLMVFHNGREARLFINGAEVRGAAGPPQWTKPGPLVIGATKDGLVGLVDEVRLCLIVKRDIYRLPAQVEFEFPPSLRPVNDEVVVAFDTAGRLDSTRHAGPVTFKVKSTADEQSITVTAQGMIPR